MYEALGGVGWGVPLRKKSLLLERYRYFLQLNIRAGFTCTYMYLFCIDSLFSSRICESNRSQIVIFKNLGKTSCKYVRQIVAYC